MKTRFRETLSVISVAVAVGLTATPALAQSDASAEDIASDGDIVVTATRESTLLSKTPIAMSAISSEGLRNQGITTPTGLSDLVPNISIDRADGLRITIRGVTSADNTEKGDPSAAFLLDGVYLARPQFAEVSFFDLERVEVLRGPQGTLFGRNTTAGLINVISATPKTDGFHASFDGQYGNFSDVNLTGMINVPVGESIALRAAVNYDRRDSYITRPAGAPFTTDPFKKNLSARLSALINFSDDARLILRGDYSKLEGTGAGGSALSNFFNFPLQPDTTPVYVDRGNDQQRVFPFAEAVQNRRDDSTWGVSGELELPIGPFVATYLGSYREAVRATDANNNIQIPGRGGPTQLRFDGDYWQNSQELRVAFGQGGRFHGQVGGYYFKEKSGIGAFGINPLILGRGPALLRFGFPQDPTISKSLAGYGQFTYDLTENLHLTGGIRYTSDSKSRVGATVLDFVAPIGRIVQNVNSASRSFKKTTWKVGIDYDVPDLGLLYATVSTGYKAGGFNDGCEIGSGASAGCTQTAASLYYNPETVTSYEAGFKLKLADNALRLNGSVFHYDYNDLQVTGLVVCGIGNCQQTSNASSAKVDGIELEAVIQPSDNDRVDLGFTFLDARYNAYNPIPLVSWAGRALDRSPRLSVTAGYAHTFNLGGGMTVVASARTKLNAEYLISDQSNRIQFRQPSATKSDISITLNGAEGRWYLQGYAKNLENNLTLTGVGIASLPGAPFALASAFSTAGFSEPRTFGLRAGFKY